MTRRLPAHTKANARSLRRRMTDAEASLWYHLRRHSIDGFKFRRQHPFGPYILDFYCPAAKLALEIVGGQHFEPTEAANDLERTRLLETKGIRVLRFTNTEALQETDAVLNRIYEALTPLPDPLPRGAREE